MLCMYPPGVGRHALRLRSRPIWDRRASGGQVTGNPVFQELRYATAPITALCDNRSHLKIWELGAMLPAVIGARFASVLLKSSPQLSVLKTHQQAKLLLRSLINLER